jgi:serine/threonine protein kinase
MTETSVTRKIQAILGAEGEANDPRLAALCVRALDILLDGNEVPRDRTAAMLEKFLPILPTFDLAAAADDVRFPARLSERFIILDVLGIGGRGQVFKALDLARLGAEEAERHVAIKLAMPNTPDGIKRLFTEWRHAQAVSHRNILRVYDVSRVGNHGFAVMEYVPGPSLRDMSRAAGGAPLSLSQITNVAQQIAHALARFHSCHRIHGDLKPSNVIFRPDGLAKLIDLGSVLTVAHIEAGIWTGGPDPHAVDLTPAYASPQRLSGDDPDPSDDIFSFAIMLSEMLGRHPFDGRPAIEEGTGRSPMLPDYLNRGDRRALTKALAPQRKSRWSNVNDFVAALSFGR